MGRWWPSYTPFPPPYVSTLYSVCGWNKFRGNNSTIPARIRVHAWTQTIPPLSGERERERDPKPDGFGPTRAPNLFRFIAFLIHKFLFNLICRHCYGERCTFFSSSLSSFLFVDGSSNGSFFLCNDYFFVTRYSKRGESVSSSSSFFFLVARSLGDGVE